VLGSSGPREVESEGFPSPRNPASPVHTFLCRCRETEGCLITTSIFFLVFDFPIREDFRPFDVRMYNVVMCDKCEELQRAVEHKQRRCEESQGWMDNFHEERPSAEETIRLANLNAEFNSRRIELEEARKNLKEHKTTHAQ